MTLKDEQLPIGQILSYALPTFSTATIMMTVAIYLPNFYTDELGLTAGMLSWVFLFGRIWDAVTDPTMGHISDRTHTRWGRRRPYFLLSALPIWLFYYLIWSPSPSLSTNGLFVHLLICYFLLYTFFNFTNNLFALNQEGVPTIVDGKKVLQSHGEVLKELTDEEFFRYQAYTFRGSSGHWMVFYIVSMTILLSHQRSKEKEQVQISPDSDDTTHEEAKP